MYLGIDFRSYLSWWFQCTVASEWCTHGYGSYLGLSGTLDMIFSDQYQHTLSNPSAETKFDDSPPWLMHWAINVAASKDIFLWFIHSILQRQRNLGDVILSWCNICYSVAACISPVFMVGNIFPWQFWQPDVLSVWCKKENFQFFITEKLSHMLSVSM